MPYAIPQAQLYGSRGRMADGNMIRNRGQEQQNTTSGNPGLPIFNTQPSPQQGMQTYGGQPQSLSYNTYPAQGGAVSNAQQAQGDMQQGNTNNFQRGIMPMFNNWNGGSAIQGIRPQPSPRGGPVMSMPVQQNTPLTWRGHPVTQGQMSGIQAALAARDAARLRYGNSINPPPVTLPIMTTS